VARSRPVTPEQRIRDLRKELRGLEADDPGRERAARLATLTRAAHHDRQLNMAMHAAALCLEDDPNDPDLLVTAYLDVGTTPEDRLPALVDLRDLARYVDRPDVVSIADEHLRRESSEWVADGDEGERRYRLRTVQTLVSREVADAIRDELEYQS
jgi:hypothetical protein